MTKQEKIREDIHDLIGDCLIEVGCGDSGCPKAERVALEAQETLLDKLLSYLHSQGVVIKVDRELPPKESKDDPEEDALDEGYTLGWNAHQRIMLKANFVAVEPLIDEFETMETKIARSNAIGMGLIEPLTDRRQYVETT